MIKKSATRYERCKECGRKIESGQWTCPNCGHTQWNIILGLGGGGIGLISIAVILLPLPTIWTLLVGGVGVILFFSAFYGVGGALRWRGWTTFMMTSLLLVMLTFTSIAARYRFLAGPGMMQSPDTVVVAAALTNTPQPSATPRPINTPVPTATPSISAVVITQLANIRSGPGTSFNAVGALAQDEVVVVVGRNADSSWVKMKTQKGTLGWVFAELLKVPGSMEDLPVLSDGIPDALI